MESYLIKISRRPQRLIATLAIFVISSVAQAVVIDFDAIPAYNTVVAGDALPVAASVITDQFSSDGVIFGRAGVSAGVAVVRGDLAPSSGLNSVAGLNAAGLIPGAGAGGALGDIYFSFLGLTDFVSFTVGDGGGDNDIFDIRAYDASDTLVFDSHYENTSRFLVEFGGFDIARVEVDFAGAYGFSLDDLTFNTVNQVPEPASLALLGLGLVGVGIARRRKL